jgi:hypothetical protein
VIAPIAAIIKRDPMLNVQIPRMAEEQKPADAKPPDEKPKEETATDDGDSLDKFDEFEKNFNLTIQALTTDRSMDKFRGEYENLHAALVTCHGQNSALIERCRALNNDILANANKVSSLMGLSKSDQRTISGLRYEFEKAWKLVEVSQERENKSKEVIDNLKAEVSTLSRLVEQGGALALTQQTSLQEISDSIASLKKEIAIQKQQSAAIHQELDSTAKVQAETKQALEELTERDADLTCQVEDERKKNTEVTDIVEKTHSEISDAKKVYTVMQEDSVVADARNSAQKEKNDALARQLREEERSIKSGIEDKHQNAQNIRTKQKLLEDRLEKNAKITDDMAKYDERFAVRDLGKARVLGELRQVDVEIEKSLAEFETARAIKNGLDAEITEFRQQLAGRRTELHQTLLKSNERESRVLAARRRMERKRTEYRHILQQKGIEVGEIKLIDGQVGILTNETLGMKAYEHKQREKIEILHGEIENYQMRASNSRSNSIQVEEERRMRQADLDSLNMDLSSLFAKIKQQDFSIEGIQNERDLACRQCQIACDENTTMSNENRELVLAIHALKAEIQDKDRTCLETHMRQKRVLTEVNDLRKKAIAFERELRNIDELNTEIRNKIQRARYLQSQAELDGMKQSQVVADLKHNILALTGMVTSRSNEVRLSEQKISTIFGLLSMGNMAYSKQTAQLEDLHVALSNEVQKCQHLANRVSHRRALMLEEIRVQKALLVERGKCRGLEDEAEKPLNVHRWRLLEGANPELSQLLRMAHELRERLMDKIVVLQRLRNAKKRLAQRSSELDGHLAKSYAGDIMEEMDYLNGLIKQKAKQLTAIDRQLSGQTNTVVGQKSEVITMRTMVRDEKAEYFGTKKKVDEIRASTAIEKSRPGITAASNGAETRFIGGGFAVGDVASVDLTDQWTVMNHVNRKDMISQVTTAHVVQPRSVSTAQKRMPPGWNPSRQPLRPRLATVSQLG